jgi:1-aminocyclopropane-1-carboxylate synthase
LNSDELPSYLARNQRVLSRAYTYLTTWLQAHHLPYTPANAGHFVLVDFRKHVEAIADERVLEKGEEPGRRETDAEESGRFKHEIVLLNRLVDGGVYLGPGTSRKAHSAATLACNGGPKNPLLTTFHKPAGFSYACADPGFFRVTFCIRRKELEIALERIESVCGLPRKAIEISRSCPE